MPYFSDDGLYDFQLEVYKYYTKDMQRYKISYWILSKAANLQNQKYFLRA